MGNWQILQRYKLDEYEANFEALVDARNTKNIQNELHLDNKVSCLLCSEDKPEKCRRCLVAELLSDNCFEIVHLWRVKWCGGWDPHPNLPVNYCFGYRK